MRKDSQIRPVLLFVAANKQDDSLQGSHTNEAATTVSVLSPQHIQFLRFMDRDVLLWTKCR